MCSAFKIFVFIHSFCVAFKTLLRAALKHTFPDIKTPNVTLSLILGWNMFVTEMKYISVIK